MKLRILAVLTLGLLGCALAPGQTFGFASAGGGLYCNYEQLAVASPGFWDGYDNLSACGSSVNSTIAGFTATLASDGGPTHGQGVIYGDVIYLILSGDPFAQWTLYTRLQCNKKNKKGKYTGPFGWFGVAAFSGVVTSTEYGYLSCTLPTPGDGEVQMRGTAAGNLRQKR
jgi:hypothetical protein